MLLLSLFLTRITKPISIKGREPEIIPCAKASGNYANTAYVNANKIPTTDFTYSSNAPAYLPLERAFNNVGAAAGPNFYWASSYESNETFHNNIYINFKRPTEIEAILYDPAYRTAKVPPFNRTFDGFPLKWNIYSSIEGRPFELVATFTGTGQWGNDWALTQFVFGESFLADKLQLEFAEVSPDYSFSNGRPCPVTGEITFIGTRDHYKVQIQNKQGIYNDNNYINSHLISSSEFSCVTSGDKDGKPVSGIFGGSGYWVSKFENTDEFKASITINFNEVKIVQAFLMQTAYRTRNGVRNFDGFPLMLNVYTSEADNQQLQLDTVFSGSPYDDWNIVQFVFKKPTRCKSLKLEFVSVTMDGSFSNFAYHAVSGAMQLIGGAEFDEITFERTTGKLDNEYEINAIKVPSTSFTYSTNAGSKDEYPFSNAFDDTLKSYWISSQEITDDFKPYVEFHFKEPMTIESFIYFLSFRTSNIRIFDGAPNEVKVYTSCCSSTEYELKAVFTGTHTSSSWSKTIFAFKEPIIVDKLKIEFIDVTPNNFDGDRKTIMTGGIAIIPTQKENIPPKTIKGREPFDYYTNTQYINGHKISKDDFNIVTSGSENQHDVSLAFDNNPSTFWRSNRKNEDSFKPYITVDFKAVYHKIDGFFMDPIDDDFTGFPITINAYTSETSDLTLQAVFSYQVPSSKQRVLFLFDKPIDCIKLKLEFESVQPKVSQESSVKIAAVSEIVLLNETGPPFTLPDEGDVQVESYKCNQKYRCDVSIINNKNYNAIIKSSHFSDYKNTENGGAIKLSNCVCDIDSVIFSDCSSEKGGGGIYISDSYQFNSIIKIANSNFVNCKAKFGGAIYVYSKYEPVVITNCNFQSTEAQQQAEGNSAFYGGNAIFLTITGLGGESSLTSLTFNEISGSVVKFYNDFDNKPSSKLLGNENVVHVKNCKFVAQKDTTSSIYYIGGNSDTLIKVSNCIFSGKLSEGSYHIDGKLISNDNPKLQLLPCKFESRLSSAINMKSNYLDNQAFEMKEDSSSKVLFSFIASAGIIIIALITLIVIEKKKQIPENSEEKSSEENL